MAGEQLSLADSPARFCIFRSRPQPAKEMHMDGERKDAYSVDEFCARNDISRAYLYLLWRRGQGPRYMKLGARRLISDEAGAEWRRNVEQAPKAAA
jgi:hypothetical protein